MAEEETILTADAPEVATNEEQSETSTETTEAAATETTESTKSDAAETEGQEETEAAGAPEEYGTFDLPDDFDMNQDTLAEYHTFAKENNLTQEQAQRGVDMVAQMKQAEMQQWVEQQKSWVEDAKADAEYGNDKFDESIAVAVKARDSFGTSEFNEMLDSSGLGNHPEMIRFLHRVGKAISENSVIVGGTTTSQLTREAVLYPSMQN